jgi:uncharacterized protein YutE (UPF0331/DUF86 family)
VADQAVVSRLVSLLSGYVQDLKTLEGVKFDEYVSDVRTRRFAERTLQMAIEACLDIGHHIIADEGFREPRDSRDVFRVLAEHAIVDDQLLPELMKMASFRNLLVHAYGSVDDTIVFGVLQKRLGDFTQFSAQILRYLKAGD